MRSIARASLGVLPIVWTVITAPLAIISALSDLFNIDGLLLAPVATYRAAAVDTASALGLSLPVAGWVIDLVMLGLAASVLAWLFFTRLYLESRSQWRAAREGRAIAVNPQDVEPDALDLLVAGTAGAGILTAGGVSHMILATGAALAGTGPIGWVAGPFVFAGVGFWALSKREEARKNAAEAHARRESLRLAAEQAAIAQSNIRMFRANERRKLLIASGIVVGIVACNFVAPLFANF